MRKSTIITIIIAILALSAGGYLAYTLWPEKEPEDPTANLIQDEVFASAATFQLENGQALYQSDFQDIFYTMDPAQYYQYADGKLTQISEAYSIDITLEVLNSPMSFTMYYLTQDNATFGVAVWRADEEYRKNNATAVYDYFFCRLMTMPQASPFDSDSFLLLLDSTDDVIADNHRLYEEAFAISKESGRSLGRVTDQRQRTVMNDGKKRIDHSVLTTDFVNQSSSIKLLTLSAAKYDYYEEGKQYDLQYNFRAKATDVAEKIAGTYAELDGSGYVYCVQDAGGFRVVRQEKSGAVTDVNKFDGNFSTDYLRNGRDILNIKQLMPGEVEIENLWGERLYRLTSASFSSVTSFAVSPDDAYSIVCGTEQAGEETTLQKIYFQHNTEGTNCKILGTSLLDTKNTQFYFTSDGSVIYNTPQGACVSTASHLVDVITKAQSSAESV